jgi:hypothetical protein
VAQLSADLNTSFLGRVVRRWYIALVGVLVTAGLCVTAAVMVPASYSATADVLLVPPLVPITSAGQTPISDPNPYISLNGLQPLADVMARSMLSGTALVNLKKNGLTGSYTVTEDLVTNSPILIVTATGTTAIDALNNLHLVLATAPTELTQLQNAQNVADASRVSSQIVANPTKASLLRKTQIRALVVAGVIGLVLAALAVQLGDLLLLRRRARKAKVSALQPDQVAVEDGEAELYTEADPESLDSVHSSDEYVVTDIPDAVLVNGANGVNSLNGVNGVNGASKAAAIATQVTVASNGTMPSNGTAASNGAVHAEDAHAEGAELAEADLATEALDDDAELVDGPSTNGHSNNGHPANRVAPTAVKARLGSARRVAGGRRTIRHSDSPL